MQVIDIVYIGSSAIGLQRMIENDSFSVKDVLCLETRVNEPLIETALRHGFEIKKFKWIKEFRELIKTYPETMPFFIYQLDMLVPADLTSKYSFYNLHRGNLFTNRGPTPDIWPILLGDKETSISLHKINDKIDAGILIDSYEAAIDDTDDVPSIKRKLEEGLPKLIRSLHEYLSGGRKGIELMDGAYRPWITEQDFTIDLAADSMETISRKIRCQRQYNGAILHADGVKHYILGILDNGQTGQEENTLTVETAAGPLTFKTNPNPKYPPPPAFPPARRI